MTQFAVHLPMIKQGRQPPVLYRDMGNRCTGSEVTLFKSWEGGYSPLPMTWEIKDVEGRRHEFVTLAAEEAVSMVE
jgi:hypothetical protein